MTRKFGVVVTALTVALFAGLAFAMASLEGCVSDDDTTDAGADSDSDADSDADSDSDTDADITFDTVEFCSVAIQFAFSGDTAYEAVLTNYNDATALIAIDNETTGGTVAENCLWPIGSIGTGNGGDEDVVPVDFQKSDTLTITIQLGEGDFLQWTCIGSIDDLFEVFPVCDTRAYQAS